MGNLGRRDGLPRRQASAHFAQTASGRFRTGSCNMSRKNNLKRRATQHDFDKRREAEALAKLEAKRLRKAAHAPVTQPEHMAVGDAGPASASAGAPPARQSPLGDRSRLQVAAGGVAKHKTKAKGFRIKKNGA